VPLHCYLVFRISAQLISRFLVSELKQEKDNAEAQSSAEVRREEEEGSFDCAPQCARMRCVRKEFWN
jgi:hypothetical protein